MAGPAPKGVLFDQSMETQGGEAGWGHMLAGLSYDSMFIFGEVDGDWRGYYPAMSGVDWQSCPTQCAPKDRGDGYCDKQCNVAGCDWDMGDCCESTCLAKLDGVSMYKLYECGRGSYDCKGTAKGWQEVYKDTTHVGKSISSTKAGENWWV